MAKAKLSVAKMATELSNFRFDTSSYVSLSPISKLTGNIQKLSASVLAQSAPKAKAKK